jgi:hypothetical protein
VVVRAIGASLLVLAPCFGPWAAEADDIAELKRIIEALRQENRALAERLATLEAEKAERERRRDPGTPPATVDSSADLAELKRTVEALRQENRDLAKRLKELEAAKTAQEDAVRSITRESLATLGSKINEAVSLGGTLEVITSRTRDFSNVRTSSIDLGAVDLELDIQATDWALGKLKIDFDTGTNVLFPTTSGFQATGVDRFTVDLAYITIGDTQRFPPFLTAGRIVVPFGISTGHPVTDTLSLNNPLTVEVFETKRDAVGFGLALPTPALKPPAPPVIAPPVKPLVINPLAGSLARALGYEPPPVRPKPPTPLVLPPPRPPVDASIYLYDGVTPGGPGQHLGAALGFNTGGHCGRPYEELRATDLCPWALNVDVNYNSSVFDSQFLSDGYQPFLNQIGNVPGMAASVRSRLGPVSLVGEWNGATGRASFLNDLGARVNIKPAAWQLSLGYQFDWNPWVQEIGEQGTFVAIGYSESRQLAGTTALVDGTPTRVGFVPERRVILTAGEWVLEGVRLLIEYSRARDYGRNAGGTGNTARGFFVALTYAF